MKYAETKTKLEAKRKHITQLRQEMRELTKTVEPESIKDYQLESTQGPVKLSTFFGDRTDLIVIHNMGTSCSYCTMWADGFNGIFDHLNARAAFVVVSPDPPATQTKFAAGRGWRFPMASHMGGEFAKDMGYWSQERGWQPGVSAFRRNGDKLLRVSDTALGPYDDFNAAWHLFDMFPDGKADWCPKFRY